MDEVLANLNTLAGKISTPPSPQRTMNSQPLKNDQPDPDAIKMFVGQIPRSLDDADLKKMFEEFGDVFQINVLRDKITGQSKGCCFVTFYTRKAALDAQNALHNIKTMPGMHHPIQMKPADSENRNERKLFVGMLSKKFIESDVRLLFSPYGTIEDCTVLRDANGQSKGCAFVTYASRQCAINAIKAMHHSQTMEGCSSPLVVKFADTQKEKDQKRLQQMGANLWNVGLGTLNPQYLALLQQAAGNVGSFSNIPHQLTGVNALGMQQLAALAAAQAAATNTAPQELNTANLQGLAALANIAAANPGLNPMSMQNLAALAAATSNNSNMLSGLTSSPALPGLASASSAEEIFNMLKLNRSSNYQMCETDGACLAPLGSLSVPTSTAAGQTLGGMAPAINTVALGVTPSNLAAAAAVSNMSSVNGLGSGLATNGPSLEALTQAYSGIQQYAAAFPNAFSQTALQQSSSPAGPEGANLFIYHLPQEFGDNDLAQTFIPFGNVISAKVFIDKQTNLSKCFGFVSYDNPVSAQAAIQAMNGFQIGMKRLKVQLKRSKDKPY